MRKSAKRFLSTILALTLLCSCMVVTNISTVFADYSDVDSLITWDFAEYGESTDEGATDDGEYSGLTYVLNSNSTSDYIYSGGIHTNGSSNAKRRYITYTPTSDGTLTVYFKSNNSSSARTCYIGTSVSTSSYLAATTTAVYSNAEDVVTATVSATLDAGTTYYVYFDNGCTASLITYYYGDVSATGISVSPTSAKIAVGGKTTLTATVTPSNTTDDVSWASSDESVAAVADGVVTGVSEGTATVTAKAGSYSASAEITVVTGTTNTITWDFSEYSDEQDTSDGTYDGLTYVLNGGNSSDYIYSGGFHTNGSSNSKRRYISYTPAYDGTLTVYFKSNNSGNARTGYIGTSVDTTNYLAATTTEVYESGEVVELAKVSASLTAGTTYYVYFDNGCLTTLITYSYVTIDDDDEDEDEYVYFGISQADVDNEEISEYYITDASGNAVVDTDGNEVSGDTVYYGVDYEDGTTAEASTLVGTDYVVAFKVTGETGDKSDLQIAFG